MNGLLEAIARGAKAQRVLALLRLNHFSLEENAKIRE